MPETPGTAGDDMAHALSDLNMMRGPGGAERTKRQYQELVEQSGFALAAVHPAGRFNVIEARPA